MPKKPTISVIIPAYNEEEYIAACLSALKKQTWKDFEVVVVDNNCTDRTAIIARRFGARIVRETQQGMTPARERGFAEAKAEIIARTDADIVVPPRWLEVIYREFMRHPQAVGVSGGLATPDPHTWPAWMFTLYSKCYNEITKLLTGHYHLFGPNMAIKKSAWQTVKVHMDDTLVHEDVDLSCHLAQRGEIIFIPELTIPYCMRRIKTHPFLTLTEYPFRYLKTIFLHHPFFTRRYKSIKVYQGTNSRI